MTAYFNAVERAYSSGLRGAYLFINVPTLDRSPGALAQTADARATYARHIAAYNAALAARVRSFAAAHPDVAVLGFDANAWFARALDNAVALSQALAVDAPVPESDGATAAEVAAGAVAARDGLDRGRDAHRRRS